MWTLTAIVTATVATVAASLQARAPHRCQTTGPPARCRSGVAAEGTARQTCHRGSGDAVGGKIPHPMLPMHREKMHTDVYICIYVFMMRVI